METRFCLFLVILFHSVAVSTQNSLKIGGIFEEGDNTTVDSFLHAIRRSAIHDAVHLDPVILFIKPGDSFAAEKAACNLTGTGVAAIFGPNSMTTMGVVAAICNQLEIPHFVAVWQPPETVTNEYHKFTLNLFPRASTYSGALRDIVVNYGWKGFTVLYENNDSLVRLHDVLQIHDPKSKAVIVRRIPSDFRYKELLKRIVKSGETRFIIDSSPGITQEILRQGNSVRLLGEYSILLFTGIDAHTTDFSEFKSIGANITVVRLVNPQSLYATDGVNDWIAYKRIHLKGNHIKTESALIDDAMRIFSSALRNIQLNKRINIEVSPLECTQEGQFSHGTRILETITNRTFNGITGVIGFDAEGARDHFILELLETKQNYDFNVTAFWDQELTITRKFEDVYTQISQSIHDKTFIVVTRIGMPYLKRKDNGTGFEGFVVDLMEDLKVELNTNYEMRLVDDNEYGTFNPETKEWNGLIGELLNRKADLAFCDLTITYERRSAVDFTTPFMTLGISILYSTPHKEPPGLFSFMQPLSGEVWLYMATAFLCISLLVYVLTKMAAADWENPHPCNKDPDELESIWNLQNCLWLSVGSIMQQGCDILPKAIPSRLATSVWWFFALIVISSYTANLAAFLTMERMEDSIESAEDLAKQNTIKYGTLKGGSTMTFFRDSNYSTYQRMYQVMKETEPTVFTKDNDEGKDRVLKSRRMYAFFMESTSIEYMTNKDCRLTRVGGLLDSKGYGIAMPVNSLYRTHINKAVLKLQEGGRVQELKKRWWEDRNNKTENITCQDSKQAASATIELKMENVGGVFLVLVAGLGISIVIGILEFLWNVRKVSLDEKLTPCEAFLKEAKFAINLRLKKKPVGPQDESGSRRSSMSSEAQTDEHMFS